MTARPFCVLIILAATSAVAPAEPQPPPPISPLQRPTVRTQDCTTSGCHAAQIERKFLHGPNAVRACDACHEPVDPAKHTFEFKRQGRELCDFCHIDKTGTEGPFVHKPVADGECLKCHDPHGAGNRKMLKKDTTPELCIECHKTINSAAHVHQPASEDCAKCHSPHTSHHAHLLVSEPRDLCLSCHQDVGTSVDGSKHPHDPAKGDCLQCHTPHASDQIKALKKSPSELCASCHQSVADTVAHATHPHSAALGSGDGNNGRACLNCHTAHASEHEKQLAKDPTSSCLECHSKPITVAVRTPEEKSRTIAAVVELASNTLYKHGPIEKGSQSGAGGCSGCHDVHGGQRDHLLVGNYSAGFYQPFSDQAYELCFKCHNRQLALAQPVDGQTGFRDGTRNLHAVHVNAGGGGAMGRSCRACHSIHTSKFQAQITDSVAYGQWKLPINFKPTETGGSCAPGCHKPESYNRSKAPVQPIGGPSPVPAPAENTPTVPRS